MEAELDAAGLPEWKQYIQTSADVLGVTVGGRKISEKEMKRYNQAIQACTVIDTLKLPMKQEVRYKRGIAMAKMAYGPIAYI